MTDKTKRLLRILAVALLFAVLTSVCWITVQADHDCAGDGCAVCARLCGCRDLLKLLVGCSLAAGLPIFLRTNAPRPSDCRSTPPATLAALKVMLLD